MDKKYDISKHKKQEEILRLTEEEFKTCSDMWPPAYLMDFP
jgi:hypothetical protein